MHRHRLTDAYTSVSYTHLDVYKRQVGNWAAINKETRDLTTKQDGVCDNTVGRLLGSMCGDGWLGMQIE